MVELTVVLIVAGMLFFSWNMRARKAERLNKMNRKSHDIQNRVAFDTSYRERVRRKFNRD